MKRKDFNQVIERAIARSKEVMYHKNDEYANSDESFKNFKEGVGISLHNEPEQYLWELMVKHLQSIKDIVSNIGSVVPEGRLVDEKFGDAHNYLYLLEGMIAERTIIDE